MHYSVSFRYPVGIPKVIRSENVNVEWQHPADIVHEGLYKVRIQPPKGKLFDKATIF